MDPYSVWSIDRQDRPSLFVGLSGLFQVLGRSCLQVGSGLLDFHSRHGRPNFLGKMRLKNEVAHNFENCIMFRYSRILINCTQVSVSVQCQLKSKIVNTYPPTDSSTGSLVYSEYTHRKDRKCLGLGESGVLCG